jgi:hypothetical protein
VEEDLMQKVRDIIEEKETLIDKTFFINSFRTSETSDSLGKYLKKVELFEKIKGEYDINYTTNDILRKHTKGVTSLGNLKVEMHEISEYSNSMRLSKKTKRDLSITLKHEELNNSIIIFKERDFRMDSQINRTLINLNKKVFIFVYDNFFNLFDVTDFKNELSELLKPINVDVLDYFQIEKTKPEKRTYSYGDVERPKQDKNIRTIYVRKFVLGNTYKDSHKYNVTEKLIDDTIENLIILPMESGELKDLDKKSTYIGNHLKEFNIEYLKNVNVKEVISFVNNLGYKVMIVGSESEYQKIKNTPHTTIEKVFEYLLKDPKVIKEFNKQIENEYISGAGMVKKDSEEYLKINSPVYKMALGLVGFDIKNYKIFKTNNKEEIEDEEERQKISFIKNTYSFRSIKNAIKNHIRNGEYNNKFEKFLSEENLESFKEKLKEQYPIFHFALKEIDSYFGCRDYDVVNDEGNIVEEGKKLFEKQLLDLLILALASSLRFIPMCGCLPSPYNAFFETDIFFRVSSLCFLP